MKKIARLSGLLLVSAALLSACNTAQNKGAAPAPNNATTQGTDRAGTMAAGQQPLAIDASKMRNDPNLETQVRQLPGIRSASVLTSGNSAFVAVVTDVTRGTGNAAGTRTAGTGKTGDTTGTHGGTFRANDTGNSRIYFADTLESDMKARVSDTIVRANPAIRNVFFITRWR